jgi:DNA-directed RNA polymerase specialized sigma24 family protein
MSPLALRRYRADRLLREEFASLRASVLANVRRRLDSGGIAIDEQELDACYAEAWQGLHAAVLAGEPIESPAGWLVVVCHRRAIDQHRSRGLPGRRLLSEAEIGREPVDPDRDVADELDDRSRLRKLVEGICSTMSERERQAACLCLLQGMTRAQAAREMGIAPRRLERLMDGRGPARPGVSAKLAAIAETIAAGGFCEQRASSMRALAFGVLDPGGERYRLAVAHQRSCPACRAYVLQLRGLAAALPPFVPAGGAVAGAVFGSRSARRGTDSRPSPARAPRASRRRRALARLRASRAALRAGSGATTGSTVPTGGGSLLAAKGVAVAAAVALAGGGAVAIFTGSGGGTAAARRASHVAAGGSSGDLAPAPRGAAIDAASPAAKPAKALRPSARSSASGGRARHRARPRARAVARSAKSREFAFERAPPRSRASLPASAESTEALAPHEAAAQEAAVSERASAIREFGIE